MTAILVPIKDIAYIDDAGYIVKVPPKFLSKKEPVPVLSFHNNVEDVCVYFIVVPWNVVAMIITVHSLCHILKTVMKSHSSHFYFL